jgi:hypothetical protein
VCPNEPAAVRFAYWLTMTIGALLVASVIAGTVYVLTR